jgi:iron(III) transport system permease protein
VELMGRPGGWRAWQEGDRFLQLAGNTARLTAGTLALALPAGIVGAVLLYRTNLPLRGLFRFLAILTLFVPLPLVATAWQAAVGTAGWLPIAAWKQAGWSPWATGTGPAILVHAVAGLPWVILLVGQSLCWVERELEEEALLAAGPWRVLCRVTLPRCLPAVCAAGLWVALQTATEVTVSDVMQVRTFAEEVNLQFALGDDDTLARAVAVTLPLVLLTGCLVVTVTHQMERTLPALGTWLRPPDLFPLGRARWPYLVLVLLVVGFLVGVPLCSLVWKAGLGGSPPTWSLQTTAHFVSNAVLARGGLVVRSLVLAGMAGAVAAALGLVVCWLGLDSPRFRTVALGLMAVAWVLPGPVVGLGLLRTFDWLISLSGSGWVAAALWFSDSPLPVLWAHGLRFFPCAVAVLWPLVRLVPRELRDAARVDGASPRQELCLLVLPLTLLPWVRATLVATVLSLGELSAAKLAATPGSHTLAVEIFMQMHTGVTNDLAALCLLLLLAVAAAGGAFALTNGLVRKGYLGQWTPSPR